MPGYLVVQFAGSVLAALVLRALLGSQGTAGLTLPGPGVSAGSALIWELMLTTGLVSVILGTASGAQRSARSPRSGWAPTSRWPGSGPGRPAARR